MASSARQISRLFVGNIPWTVSREQLSSYFAQFGRVRDARLIFNNKTGMSKGFGFVQFQNQMSIQDVFAKGNHNLEGQELIIRNATVRNP